MKNNHYYQLIIIVFILLQTITGNAQSKRNEKLPEQLKEVIENRKQINQMLGLEFDSLAFQRSIFYDNEKSTSHKEALKLLAASIKKLEQLYQSNPNSVFQEESLKNILSNEIMFAYLYKKKNMFSSSGKLPDDLYDMFLKQYLVQTLEIADEKSMIFTNSPTEYLCIIYLQINKGIRPDVVAVYVSELDKTGQFKYLTEKRALKSSYSRDWFEKVKKLSVNCKPSNIGNSIQNYLTSQQILEGLKKQESSKQIDKTFILKGFKMSQFIGFRLAKIGRGINKLEFNYLFLFDLLDQNKNYSPYLFAARDNLSYIGFFYGIKDICYLNGYTHKAIINKHFAYYSPKKSYDINSETCNKLLNFLENTNLKDAGNNKLHRVRVWSLGDTFKFLYSVMKYRKRDDLLAVVLNNYAQRLSESENVEVFPNMIIDLLTIDPNEEVIKVAKTAYSRSYGRDRDNIREKLLEVCKNSKSAELYRFFYNQNYREPDVYKVIKKNGKQGVATVFDKIIVPPIYDYASIPENEKSIVAINGKYGVINDGGKVLLDFKYDSIYRMDGFLRNYFILKQDGKYGVKFQGGLVEQTIPVVYDEIIYNKYKYFVLVRKGSKYGVYKKDIYRKRYNSITKKSLPCIYDKVHLQSVNIMHLYKDGKLTEINKDFHFLKDGRLVEPQDIKGIEVDLDW